MARLAFKDELLDAQLLRVVGSAAYEGADVGECLAVAARVRAKDLTSWYQCWSDLARTNLALSETELEAGRTVSARGALFRASSYYRTAGVMLMARPLDPRLVDSHRHQTDAFRRGAALLPTPPELLAVPYEQTTLPGYFFRVDADVRPRATVILLNGYDGTAEELYFFNGAAALARGYNVVAFDGPGQGAALLQGGLPMRHDYEHVVTAVVDHIVQRPDVDAHRLALIGLSLGGYLAPRAASEEHRLAACIADCGSFDMYRAATERIPSPLRSGLDDPSSRTGAFLDRLLAFLERQPTAGWALRRGQLVHGVDGPREYLQALTEYTLVDAAPKVQCPTLVCYADHDDISASAPQLAAALTCPHELIEFAAHDGAGDHCEVGARTLYHARSFAWLDDLLHPNAPTTNTAISNTSTEADTSSQ